MAVEEMMDYLENGNIRNSVNYPACDMGICAKAGRVAIFHKNIANMITKFTAEFGEKGINISDMTNKSRGKWRIPCWTWRKPLRRRSSGRWSRLRACSGSGL